MSEPVAPISGAYPPPAIIVRNDGPAQARQEATPPAAVAGAAPARMIAGHTVALAGGGWVPVLHTTQRRGLRADEAERRRYRASYASAGSTPAAQVSRMERRA